MPYKKGMRTPEEAAIANQFMIRWDSVLNPSNVGLMPSLFVAALNLFTKVV